MQVHLEVAPLPRLPEVLFLVVFAGRSSYAYNRTLTTLERVSSRAPDAGAVAAGMSVLLRQFHPAYTDVRPKTAGTHSLSRHKARLWAVHICVLCCTVPDGVERMMSQA